MSLPPTIPPALEHTYAQAVPAGSIEWNPTRWPQAREVWFNASLDSSLGLGLSTQATAARAAWLSGSEPWPGSRPMAQAYAGHQFGGFSPQLGDGRALLLGEWRDPVGLRWDLALKGSGRTPFSRGGDGKAALGPMLRELILGEAMHALGVPTTRALAVVATGEPVIRDRVLPGAVLTRVASSHLRVGTFEFFAARGDRESLRQLAEYAIARHDPELTGHEDRHRLFLQAVIRRQARLIAQWMHLGFIHGVMNTDNMTVSGQTIDYGPCAFLEAYAPATVFSSIDRQGRYAFGNQPAIAQWNLARLAETLLPLIDADEDQALERVRPLIAGFASIYQQALHEGYRRKLGFRANADGEADANAADSPHVSPLTEEAALITDWLALLERHQADHTRAWRSLSGALSGNEEALAQELPLEADARAWLRRWRQHLDAQQIAPAEAAQAMARVNPAVIPRNHQVERALAAASGSDDLQPLQALLQAVTHPWDEAGWHTEYAQAAAAEVTAQYRTFCGT